MDLHLQEIETIANSTEPPTFENTIVAMERAGRTLDRMMAYWGIWSANRSTPKFRKIQHQVAPQLAEFRSKITQNQRLSTRIRAVYETGTQSQLLELYHTADPAGLDADAFERQALADLKMPHEIVMRHRSPHFGHIFSSEGYAAGYYGYMWADVLIADAAEAFEEAPGGCCDKDLAKKLVNNLLAARNAVDPAAAYRAFRNRDAQIDALMRARRFSVAR